MLHRHLLKGQFQVHLAQVNLQLQQGHPKTKGHLVCQLINNKVIINIVDSMETPDNLATLLQNYCAQELPMCHCFH